MILEDRKLLKLIVFILLGIITFLFVHLVVKRVLGYPIASYWGIVFFGALTVFFFLLREAFGVSYDMRNFMNYRYYLTLQPIMAILIAFPCIMYLIFMVSKTAVYPDKKAVSIFAGMVESVSKAPTNNIQYDLVKFTVEKIDKGTEFDTYSAKSGLIVPTGCGLSFNPGELYIVYIMNYFGFDYIACVGTKKIDKIETNTEEAPAQ